ncbi:Predicted butyrate kinase, DUF1464 family [Singulisphaera sp. GP187]|uniref:DUF1464 family protein n=1 Tax=Singulisphaera sp. GP187 TaxID=1882752 RepID=UPI0009288684|nr:DUF1464 family protein [Singulisphaera sp. GP187]SIN78202.1 Predicted butyrate kinase, DUF1464 family [Singulisphaera sp. GP187]
MVRVVGTDPGTSSLDLLLLADGAVVGQERLSPGALQRDPEALVSVLRDWLPIDLIAGPSGYGLPLVRAADLTDRDFEEMSLVRPDQRGIDAGVVGFRSWVRALAASGLPVLFLPGGVHLPSIPAHRKLNTIDLGTADKVAVTALALQADAAERGAAFSESTFAVVELGSAFSAVMIVSQGRLVDAAAGTRGPIGVRSGGCWDGEVAYWCSPLTKDRLFRGGLIDLGPEGPDAFRESLTKHVAGLKAVTPFDRIYLSGASADRPELAALAHAALEPLGAVIPLRSLPGAWVKHAAQGAALLADGLAGGRHAGLVASLELAGASGTVWDGLRG